MTDTPADTGPRIVATEDGPLEVSGVTRMTLPPSAPNLSREARLLPLTTLSPWRTRISAWNSFARPTKVVAGRA